MRELKFRAWDKDVAKYVDWVGELYVDILEVGTKTFRIEQMCPGRYIIEQYTGLKDKNGKEIYEGDIIQEEIDFNSKMTDGVFTYVVEWDSDTLCYRLRGSSDSIHDELWEVNASVEIIGNIHENSELLGEEE